MLYNVDRRCYKYDIYSPQTESNCQPKIKNSWRSRAKKLLIALYSMNNSNFIRKDIVYLMKKVNKVILSI